MTNQEVLELLRKIDRGYKPTKAAKEALAGIKEITWPKIEKIPDCIDILTGVFCKHVLQKSAKRFCR